MNSKQDADTGQKPSFIRLSTYFPMIGYTLIALLIRILAWSPVAVLFVEPLGWEIRWVVFLAPAFLLFVVLPMRFSFARAATTAVRGEPFSVWRALRLTQYRKKLTASLKHVLRMAVWSAPMLLAMAGLYTIYQMNVAGTMRTIAALGKGAAAAISGVHNFFTGIFGGGSLQLKYDFPQGLYVMYGIVALALLILVCGAWRCSVYRYLWAYHITRSNGAPVKIRHALRGYRWKQLFYGLYNLFLWLPSLFFVFLLILSVQSRISAFTSALLGGQASGIFLMSAGEVVLILAGLLIHLLLLPVRRSVTAAFVISTQRRKAQ